MSSRILLIGTAVICALGGFGLLFAPDLVGGGLTGQAEPLRWPLQLLGAAWCGQACLNWLSRGATVGGLFGRPVVASNLVHFLVAALVVAREILHGNHTLPLWLVFIMTGALAVTYGMRMNRQPSLDGSAGAGATAPPT